MFRCMHVCVEIFTYMYAEFTCVYIHIYMYFRQVYLCECICLRICTPSLQVVYVFPCRQTEFTCVCVYIYIYAHGNYIYVGVYSHICTPSLQMGVRRVHMYVCMYWHTCAYTPTYVCLCVCVCIHMYTYMYEKTTCVHTNLHMCVYIIAYSRRLYRWVRW